MKKNRSVLDSSLAEISDYRNKVLVAIVMVLWR
jgi:hypothetical protein